MLREFLKAKCELASVEQLELQHTGILHLFTSYFHGSLPGVDEKDWGRSQKARGSPTQWHRHAGDYLLLLRGLHLVSHACLHGGGGLVTSVTGEGLSVSNFLVRVASS